jgi:hypothetical protein
MLLVSLFAVPAFAIDPDAGGPIGPSDTSPLPPQVSVPNVFGTPNNILQLPASSFVPMTPGTLTTVYDTNAYLHPSAAGWLWTTVTLPAGVNISFLDLYANDTNVGSNVAATLRGYTGGALGVAPSNFDVAVVSSSGSAGYGYFIGSTSHTVNNNVVYADGSQYAVFVYFPVADGSLQFKGVDIWWNRQISDAPATATFTDVPTSHPFFQHIEALAASGVSTGYADGSFKPGDYVTRQAMAAFLARALGLHWDH